jgi:hypothetical protein
LGPDRGSTKSEGSAQKSKRKLHCGKRG